MDDKPLSEMTEADYARADQVWEIISGAYQKLVREYAAFTALSSEPNPHPLTVPNTIANFVDGLGKHELAMLLTAALYDQHWIRLELVELLNLVGSDKSA